MKAGSFKLNDYLERLHEEKEASSKVPVEGLIIPEENKKTFNWLKKEYQKGKTEVKVEMRMGGSKFEPGYELQTDLKSVKDFKPGMFGDVKTSDTEGSKKKEGGQPASKTTAEKPAKAAPKKEVKGVGVKNVDAEEKEEKEEKEGEEHEEKEEKKEDKKKLQEGLEVIQEGTQNLEPEALAYLNSLPFTRKPDLDDLYYAKKIQVDPQLEGILAALPVVNFDTYQDLLGEYGDDFPFKKFFIANINEEDGVSFLVRPDGFDYARYIAELI